MKWTKITKSEITGKPILYSKTLLDLFGFSINVHKIVDTDPPGRFHTHPANAIRVILKGGYVEELYADPPYDPPVMLVWTPGAAGVVKMNWTHRIAALRNGPSWSLWLRGRTQAMTFLRGQGWPAWLRNRGV